jgi:hypothetical protein
MTKNRLGVLALTTMLLAFALPTAAQAEIVEIGRAAGEEIPAPSCPTSPCFAVSRTTGYQAKVGTNRGIFKVQNDGYIVAWTIRLSKPGARQIAFFDQRLGGEAQAGISVLKPGKRLFGRVLAQSPLVELEPFFGQTVQFPLERAIPVKKGNVIALSVPTWAPAMITGVGEDTSWRASRKAGECDDTETQTAQTAIRALAQYRCLYQRVRLAYSATMITTPTPNKTPKKKPANR